MGFTVNLFGRYKITIKHKVFQPFNKIHSYFIYFQVFDIFNC